MSFQSLKRTLLPDTLDFIGRLIRSEHCGTALDIGCGKSSHLSSFRPSLKTVGLDAFTGAIETSRRLKIHDDYILANVMEASAEDILFRNGGEKFDLVTMFDLIEHLPRKMGWELLEKCEKLTRKFILLQTPYGFLEQGPEDNNIYQCHLSGWFPHDFASMGYKVVGCAGTRLFHGYAGEFKWNFPGVKSLDFAAGVLLNLEKNPQHALNMVAWKDVRPVPVRLKL